MSYASDALIDAQEREIKKFKRENAQLLEMLSESRQANERLYTELKRYESILRSRPNAMTALYDENAKLREYANILAKSAMIYGPCDWCPYKDDEDACDCDTLPMRDECKFNDELRKLGVKAR